MVGVALAVLSEPGENRVAIEAEHTTSIRFWRGGRVVDTGQRPFIEENRRRVG